MAKKRYKTVLFDADNTLLDFSAAEAQALRRTMEARGLPFTPENHRVYVDINRSLWDALHRGQAEHDWLSVERFRRFARYLGADADPAAWDREYLDRLGDCGDLIPGALELVKALRPHCALALATNGLRQVQTRRLLGNPIAPYLDGVFISQDMGVAKPDPAYFRQVLAALGAEGETTVMVGDDLLSDIQGARNAGLDSIWYAPGGGHSPLPTYQVDRLGQVAHIILGREI